MQKELQLLKKKEIRTSVEIEKTKESKGGACLTNQVLDVKEIFKSSPFFAYIGFESLDAENGSVVLKLRVKEELLNVNGTIHGGVHAAMLDTIMGMTIRSVTNTPCATVSLNVNYLNSSSSGEILATAKILSQGYRLVNAEAEMVDENGVMLAKGVGTFKLIRSRNK